MCRLQRSKQKHQNIVHQKASAGAVSQSKMPSAHRLIFNAQPVHTARVHISSFVCVETKKKKGTSECKPGKEKKLICVSRFERREVRVTAVLNPKSNI